MLSLVFKTLVHFRGLLVPVALGVAVASAVIVGALVVGDSMRGSLRFIAMDRIGSIETVLVAPRWFDESLVQNIDNRNTDSRQTESLVYVQQAIAEHDSFVANEMALLGVEQSFWSLGTIAPNVAPGDDEVILNQTLADKLHVAVGDVITLRVATQAVVPADSPLGKREQDSIVLPRWKVVSILPDRSVSRFSLRSDQRPIMNAFANKRSLQKALEIPSKVNAVFVSQANQQSPSTNNPKVSSPTLLEGLSPKLSDLGLSWQHVTRSFPNPSLGDSEPKNEGKASEATTVLDYRHLTTDQMLISPNMVEPILGVAASKKPSVVLTYLANGAQGLKNNGKTGRNVPYSTISAVDWHVLGNMLGSTETPQPKPSDANWVVVTRWLADELAVEVGDTIRIEYYLPETVDGEEIEKSYDLTLAAIAPLTEPKAPFDGNRPAQFEQPPTPFNDPAWTPVVPGITDQESISKWDTPFPLTRKIEKQDDEYWKFHRLTPKLYVSQEVGLQLFGSRFGNASSLRFDGLDEQQAAEIETKITAIARKEMPSLGWREIPLRRQQLQAASGTTPFDALFLSLSFFVIIAALLLVALLFRLAIEQRADHWGLLLASGWTRSSVRRLLLLEGGVVSGIGATLGVGLGLLYAYAMISGLRSWWLGAITVSFLNYHAQPLSLALGWLLGWLAALATILVSTRQLKRITVAKLLKKQMDTGAPVGMGGQRRSVVAIACIVLAVCVLALGQFLQGQAQAGAFVGGGMLFLMGGLFWAFASLRSAPASDATASSMIDASSLASSNAKRAPFRSILAIGLVAVASFLILSMSLFQSLPNTLGTGGFAFVGKSSYAIHKDLANPEYQRDVLGNRGAALKDFDFVPLRVRGGDDASCNNLFQASEPQVLGVATRMDQIDRNRENRTAFGWFATGKVPVDHTPWVLLETEGTGTEDAPVPVVLDQNTALWALHLGGYVGERFDYTFDDRKVHFQTVGVLQNTILQGSLLIGEANFERLFPAVTGHKLFLIKSKAGADSSSASREQTEQARKILENGWSDSGLSLAYSDDVLRQLLAVQNTYLGAFQVLGALGLLLGTMGLGIAQLRSAMERRGELAAMRAIGFTKSRLIWLLTLENGWQLLRGIGIGVGSAALATLPAILSGQPYAGLAWPATMLGVVIVTGLLCSVAAAWGAMRWPLLQALRADK